jgi:uncharacterized membrane protein HdeD (DUF308 family)
MESAMTTSRWLLFLRGILAVIFGVVVLVWPVATFVTMLYFFAFFAIIYGVVALVEGLFSLGKPGNAGALIAIGIAGIAAGLIALVWPGFTALMLVYLIAAWAIVTGVGEIVTAVRFGGQMTGEWLLVIAGIVAIIFGIYVFLFPGTGILSVLFVVGIFAIVWGLIQIVQAFLPRRRTAATPV